MIKKMIVLVFIGLVVAVPPGTFAQVSMSDIMLNLNRYSSIFLGKRGWIDSKYTRVASDEDLERIAALAGRDDEIDTALEIALLSSAAGVVNVRPVEATQMLGTPRQEQLKLGAALIQEISIMRFLGNTAAVGRLEAELKYRIDRGNVTRAEIETFYRNGIRKLVSDIVDEEFGKPGRDNIIPSRVYATWKTKGIAQGVDAIELIKETLTNFFLDSTRVNYEKVCGIRARYIVTLDSMSLSANDDLSNTIRVLGGEPLINKLMADVTYDSAVTLAKIPPDSRFNVFSVPYGVGGPAR